MATLDHQALRVAQQELRELQAPPVPLVPQEPLVRRVRPDRQGRQDSMVLTEDLVLLVLLEGLRVQRE